MLRLQPLVASHNDRCEHAIATTMRVEAQLRSLIDVDREMGSRKHDRVPAWMRFLPRLVIMLDFCIFAYYFGEITDENWGSPLSAHLTLAILLGGTATTAIVGLLLCAGSRLRVYKDHSGVVRIRDIDALTGAMASGSFAMIAVFCALLFVRMRADIADALGAAAAEKAILIASMLAVVSAMGNVLVMVTRSRDGSDDLARLEALSAAAARTRQRGAAAACSCRSASTRASL